MERHKEGREAGEVWECIWTREKSSLDDGRGNEKYRERPVSTLQTGLGAKDWSFQGCLAFSNRSRCCVRRGGGGGEPAGGSSDLGGTSGESGPLRPVLGEEGDIAPPRTKGPADASQRPFVNCAEWRHPRTESRQSGIL